MIQAWTPQEVRAAEAPLLDAGQGPALMAKAAAALTAVCVRELRSAGAQQNGVQRTRAQQDGARRGRTVYGSRVAVLAGKGNNGGDALYAAARLAGRGVRVDVVLTAGDAHPGGVRAARTAGCRLHDLSSGPDRAVDVLRGADLVVDGIVGTGARAGLRSPVREIVADLFAKPDPRRSVVAVDVPSGIDASTGELAGPCIDADVTVAFAGAKPGLLLPPATRYAGTVEIADIGIPLDPSTADAVRLAPSDIGALWPAPGPDAHKYTRGVLGVVAGSAGYPGAAVLATGGARAAGVGMIRYLGPDRVAGAVTAAYPEVVPGRGRVQAWLLGPGIDPADDDRMAAVRRCLAESAETQQPCIVDAGALAAVDPAGHRPDPPMILTPHAGELAALLSRLGSTDVSRDAVEAAPAVWARHAAREIDAVVVLKGPVTVIAQPHGPTYGQGDGPSWLATAGAGDVLAGIIGAITAASVESPTGRSLPALAEYAALGVLAHGIAADRASAGGPIAAGDVAAALPAAVASYSAGFAKMNA